MSVSYGDTSLIYDPSTRRVFWKPNVRCRAGDLSTRAKYPESLDRPCIDGYLLSVSIAPGCLLTHKAKPRVNRRTGDTVWRTCGALHRIDGPTIERADGDHEWWLQGRPCPREEVYAHFLNRAFPELDPKNVPAAKFLLDGGESPTSDDDPAFTLPDAQMVAVALACYPNPIWDSPRVV